MATYHLYYGMFLTIPSISIIMIDHFCHKTHPRYSQLTHNVFITLLESYAELFWDKRCSNIVATFDQNVVTTLQQRYLATYNVAATLFGNISPTFAQSCLSMLW